ncbi:hypothetical protein FPY71_14325 [Aureimonas fodinaquatilis]|uniref:Uncharacterized protein n=1 Tax=Aureimonas fodinaquatilis TaxID=2565783 RepID=A0A5B0DV67_9HYPH|nr:hypothetical protein [Aureimonas fodinaquatilis]KAA0969691.1 hypothetical protein FPY71_14325 [Aureimonas fodinaquatilis]
MSHWLVWPMLVLSLGGDNAATSATVATAATPLFLERCEQREEGPVKYWRCAGLPGTDVFVQENTGRFSVSLGNDRATAESFEVPHVLGKTMEWRILGNQAQSGIVRYRFAASQTGQAQDLLVIMKVADKASNGCIVAIVDAAVNSAVQELARRTADERVPNFVCGRDKVAIAGRATDRTVSELLPSLK